MYPVLNTRRTFLGQEVAQYSCPTPEQIRDAGGGGAEGAFAVSYDPNLNCMRDARGNAICSDGLRYPPG